MCIVPPLYRTTEILDPAAGIQYNLDLTRRIARKSQFSGTLLNISREEPDASLFRPSRPLHDHHHRPSIGAGRERSEFDPPLKATAQSLRSSGIPTE